VEDTLYESNFGNVRATGTRGNIKGKHVRDYFAKYFTSPHGAVPWQYDKSMIWNLTYVEKVLTFVNYH